METIQTLELTAFWQQGIFDSFQGIDRAEIKVKDSNVFV